MGDETPPEVIAAPVLTSDAVARRRYQRGSLQLVNGCWVGRWREDIALPDGTVRRRHRQEQLGTRAELPTKRLAQRALASKLAEVNAPGYRPRAALTLWALVQKWQTHVLSQQRHSTRNALEPQLAKHVRGSVGQLQLAEVTGERLQQWVAALPCAPKTKMNLVAALRSAWACAVSWGYVSVPFPSIRIPRPPIQRGRAFSADEVRRIVAAAPEPFGTLYALLAETGLRAGEALGLRWESFEATEGWLSVTESVVKGTRGQTKSGRSRLLRISPGLRARLAALPRTGPLMFPNRRGIPHRPDRLDRRHLRPLLADLGIPCPPRTGLHAFRHANATELLRAGVPLRTVQTRLGHSDPATTLRIYAHVVEADQEQAANTAAAAFGTARTCAEVAAKRT